MVGTDFLEMSYEILTELNRTRETVFNLSLTGKGVFPSITLCRNFCRWHRSGCVRVRPAHNQGSRAVESTSPSAVSLVRDFLTAQPQREIIRPDPEARLRIRVNRIRRVHIPWVSGVTGINRHHRPGANHSTGVNRIARMEMTVRAGVMTMTVTVSSVVPMAVMPMSGMTCFTELRGSHRSHNCHHTAQNR